VRHHEAQRPHDVRRGAQQGLAFLQCFAHEPELAVLEVAQAAVNQLGTRRRCMRREVVLFAKQHGQSAAGRVARDARAVDPAAHDEQIVFRALRHLLRLLRRMGSGLKIYRTARVRFRTLMNIFEKVKFVVPERDSIEWSW
jgi:hypothetical protein